VTTLELEDVEVDEDSNSPEEGEGGANVVDESFDRQMDELEAKRVPRRGSDGRGIEMAGSTVSDAGSRRELGVADKDVNKYEFF
jgi:hypothetical protein